MKYVLILILAFTFSTISLADDNTVKLCVDMLNKKQAQTNSSNKVSDKQAKTYCGCIIPKLEQIKTGSTPTAQELNKLYSQCMNKAGIQLSK